MTTSAEAALFESADQRRGNADPGIVIIDHRNGLRGPISEWVETFAQTWADPRHQLDRLMALLDPGIVLIAPTQPPKTVGYTAGRRAFERAFRAMPDLRATTHRWSATGDVLFIEMTFHATIGGRSLSWHDVDRILFRNESAVERVAYFDPGRVRRAFMRNMKGWAQFLRLRLGP